MGDLTYLIERESLAWNVGQDQLNCIAGDLTCHYSGIDNSAARSIASLRIGIMPNWYYSPVIASFVMHVYQMFRT